MPLTDSNLEGLFTFETGAKPSDEEPPFHLLFLGDWSGNAAKAEIAKRRPLNVDRDNFHEVMQRLGVGLDLDLNFDGKDIISLSFGDIDDFHPDNLFRDVSIFEDLRDVRRRLKNADTFEETAGQVRSWFNVEKAAEAADRNASAEQPPAPDAGNLLDQILSHPGDAGSAAKPAKIDDSDLGRLVSKVVTPYLVSIDESEQAKLVSAVDSAISDLMRSVLHHPEFQALESAWRGLYFLIRRVETDLDLKVFIFDLSKDECADNLKSVSSLADSVLYRQLIAETIETPGGEPWALIGGNYTFGVKTEDVAALMRIGRLAAGADAPFVFHLSPELFGIRSFGAEIDSSTFRVDESSAEAKLWSALRMMPEAAYLGASPMRFLARMPYGAKTDSVETFEFEEVAGEELPHDHFVWTNPVFACALLLAQSYRLYGWDMGQGLRHDIEGLPMYYDSHDGDTRSKPCAEVLLTESVSEKILEQGLMPLLSYRDSDRIRLARFQAIRSPAQKLGGRWNH